MAQLDRGRRFQAGEEGREFELVDVGRELGRGDARHVLGDHFGEGVARRLAQRIEDGAIEQRWPVAGDQRIEAQRCALLLLLAIGAGEQAERCGRTVGLVVANGDVERLAQLIEVLRVGEFGTLLEPFGGQRLRRHALAAPPIGQRDANADHRLDAFGHGDDAETEGQPQDHRPLVALDLLQPDLHARSSRPEM